MSIALVGGTGIDEMAGLSGHAMTRVATLFGEAEVTQSELGGRPVTFIPRHGAAHSCPPSAINYRAQMAALKTLGVTRIIAVCAVGSLHESLSVGAFAVLGDFIDLTRRRDTTFFDSPDGPVVHTDFSEPYCPEVSEAIVKACGDAGINYAASAVYVGVDGPRYESPAEVKLYSSWGGQVIGMTGLPEAVLAREAGICYGSLAVVTNVAVGCPTPVSHDDVRATMRDAGDRLRDVIARAVELIPDKRRCRCGVES